MIDLLLLIIKSYIIVGASLKDLGKKCFAISKILDNEYIKILDNYEQLSKK